MKLEKYTQRLHEVLDDARGYHANYPSERSRKRLDKYEDVIDEAISLKTKNKQLKQEIKDLKKQIETLEEKIPFDDELEEEESEEYDY